MSSIMKYYKASINAIEIEQTLKYIDVNPSFLEVTNRFSENNINICML